MARIGNDTRYVRTAEGAQFYGLPIGAPIRPDIITKRNRQAATIGIRPPQGAIEDSRGRAISVPDAQPEVKVADPTLSGPLKFKVGDREFTAPEGSRLFGRRGNDGMRYVMSDGAIHGFNHDGQADVPEALQKTLAERFDALDESDDRYEELDFDGGAPSTDAQGGAPSTAGAAPATDGQEGTAAVPDRVEDMPGYISDEEIAKRIKAASIDQGSSSLDLLEERMWRSNDRIRQRWERMRTEQETPSAGEGGEQEPPSAGEAGGSKPKVSALDELRARRDETIGKLRKMPDENAAGRSAADAPVGTRLLDAEGTPQFEKVAGGWKHASGILAPVPDGQVQGFLDSGELTIEGRADEKSFGEMTHAEFVAALDGLPDGTRLSFSVAEHATKVGDAWQVEGAVARVESKDLYFFKTSIKVIEDKPDPESFQAGDLATAGFIQVAPTGSQISYVSADEVDDIEQTRVTVWTKQDDGTWVSETSGGTLAEHIVIDALDEQTLIARVGPEMTDFGDRLYPGADPFDEADVRAAYDGLVEHTGFQVFYGVPQGNPLRDREIVGALTTEARSKYPNLSPKQAVLAHLRDHLGIETPKPDDGPSVDEPTLVIGSPEPKRTGVQGMNGGQYTRTDIEEAISILEEFKGKAFKSELNKRGNRLGELDPSSLVGIHKDKTEAKRLFIEHLRGVLGADTPTPAPEPTEVPSPTPDPTPEPEIRTPEELVGQSPETLAEVQQLPVGARISFLGFTQVRNEDRRWRSINSRDFTEGGYSDEDIALALRGVVVLRVDTPLDEEVPRPNWTIGEYRVGESIVARHQFGTAVWTRLPDENGQAVWSGPNGTTDYADNMPEILLAYEQGFRDPADVGLRWFARRDPQAPENEGGTTATSTVPSTASGSTLDSATIGKLQVTIRSREDFDALRSGSFLATDGSTYDRTAEGWKSRRMTFDPKLNPTITTDEAWAIFPEGGTVSVSVSEDDPFWDRFNGLQHGVPFPVGRPARANLRDGDTLTHVVDGNATSYVKATGPDGEPLWVQPGGSALDDDDFHDLLRAGGGNSSLFMRRGSAAPGASGEPDGTNSPVAVGDTVKSADLGGLVSGTRIGYLRKKDGRTTHYTKQADGTFVTDKGNEVDISGWRSAEFTVVALPEGVNTPTPTPTPAPTPPSAPVDLNTVPVGVVIQVTLNVDGDSENLGYEGSGWKAGETRYLRKAPYGWETSDAHGFKAEYEGRYGLTSMTFGESEAFWMQRNGQVTTDFDPGPSDPRWVRQEDLLEWSRGRTLRGRVLEIEMPAGRELVRNVIDGGWLRPNGQSIQQGSVISLSESGKVRTPEEGAEWVTPENAVASLEQIEALRPGSVLADHFDGLTYVKQDDGTWLRERLHGTDDPKPASEIWARVSRYESPGAWQVAYSAPSSDSEAGVQAGDRVLVRQVQDLPVGSIVDNDGVYSIIRADGTAFLLSGTQGPNYSSAPVSDYHQHTSSRDVRVVRVGPGVVPGRAVPTPGESFDRTDVDLMLSMPIGTRFSGPQFVRHFSSRSGQEDTTYVVAADGILLDEKTGKPVGLLEFSNVSMTAAGERKPDPVVLEPRVSDPAVLDTIESLNAAPVGTILIADDGEALVKTGETSFSTSRTHNAGSADLSSELVLDNIGRTQVAKNWSLDVPGETRIASQKDLDAVTTGSIVYDASAPKRAWVRNSDGSWWSAVQNGEPTFSGDLRVVPADRVPTKQRSDALAVQVLTARKGTRLRVAADGKNITYEFDGRRWTETGSKRYPSRMAPAQMVASAAVGRARVWAMPEDDTKALVGVDIANDEQFWKAFSALSDEGSIEAFAKRRLPKVNWISYTAPAGKSKADRDDRVALYREYMGAAIQFFEHYPQLQGMQSVGGVPRDPKEKNAWAWVRYNRGTGNWFSSVDMRFHMTTGLREHLNSQSSQGNFHVSGAREEISAPLRTVIHESGHAFDAMTNMSLGRRAQAALDEYLKPFPKEQQKLIRSQFGTYSHTNTREFVAETFELWHTFDDVDPAVEHVMAAIQDEFRILTNQPDFEFKKFTGDSFSEAGRLVPSPPRAIEDILTAGNTSRAGEPLMGSGYGYLTGTVARVSDSVYEKDGSTWYEIDQVTGLRTGSDRLSIGFGLGSDPQPNSEILREGLGYAESGRKPFASPSEGYVRSGRAELLSAAEPGSTIVVDGTPVTKGADGYWHSENGLRLSTSSLLAKTIRATISDNSRTTPKTEPALIELDNLMFSDYTPTPIGEILAALRNRG